MKTCFNFLVCDKLFERRTQSLINTVCKDIIANDDDYYLVSYHNTQYNNLHNVIKASDTDDYLSGIDKTLNCFKFHLYNNTQFDYFFLGDDDTFIDIKQYNTLLNAIKNREQLEVFGHVKPIQPTEGDHRYHVYGGPGLLMNRKTFLVLANHIKQNNIRHTRHLQFPGALSHGDVSVALNIHHYNSTATDKINFVNVQGFYSENDQVDPARLITLHAKDKYDIYKLYKR